MYDTVRLMQGEQNVWQCKTYARRTTHKVYEESKGKGKTNELSFTLSLAWKETTYAKTLSTPQLS